MALPDFFTKGHSRVRGRRVANKLSANGTVVLPKGVILDAIYFRNQTGNVVTGGVKIGTTSGGTDIVAAQAVGANAVVRAMPAASGYDGANNVTLYIQPVTAWNSAVIDVVVDYTEVTTRTEPTSNLIAADSYK